MPLSSTINLPGNVMSTTDVAPLPAVPVPGIPKTSFLTDAEQAEWDRLLPHEELVKQAQASPPPASWYEEEFIR